MAEKGAKDSRFSSIKTDPRFKLPKKKSIRGELDSRFKDVLETDERFKKKSHIDRYGKKVKSKDAKKELSKYYNFEEDEDQHKSSSSSSSEDEDEDDVKQKPKQKSKPKPSMRELMRGEGIDSDDSDDSDSDDSDESEDSSEDEDLVEQRDEYERVRGTQDAVPQGDESRRFAVVNLDWDNITSTDLMATFSSFLSPSQSILSVKIYPSEYGKKQMAIEEMSGPSQDLFDKNDVDNTKKEVNDDGDEDYSSSKLRRYQLQRLQYYYAVVECDSVESASNIYANCDGTEYESTANFFDLRFIPDEVDFSNDKPRDECTKVPANYKPANFTTDALQHSKVKLTWDETPKERLRIAQKAFSNADIEDNDLKAYLASESDEEDEATIAQKYRSLLLGEGNDGDAFGKDKSALLDDGDDAVEITFNPVLEGKEATLEIIGDNNNSAKSTNEENYEDNLSTIEKYKLKEKQRKLRRMENYRARKAAEQLESNQSKESDKAALELLAMDDELLSAPIDKSAGTDITNTNDQKKKKKKQTKRAAKKQAEAEAEADFDTADPRFQALYEDPDFAIDSTIPQFKKTKGMEKIISERRNRQQLESSNKKTNKQPKRKIDSESTSALVSKLRRKHA